MSTGGMLLYLLDQGAHRRRRAERDTTISVFKGVLRNMVRDGQAVDLLVVEPPPAEGGACVLGANDAGGDPSFCMHVRHFVDGFRASPVNSHQSQLACLLLELFAGSSMCVTLRAWAAQRIRMTAEAIDEGLRFCDLPADPLKYGLFQTGQRGVRIDEDYKRALAQRVILEGRAASSSAFLRGQGELNPSLGPKVESRWLTEYQLESRATLVESRTVGVVLDASRIGEPAMDLYLYLAYSPDIGRSSWLPPQVVQLRGWWEGDGGPRFELRAICTIQIESVFSKRDSAPSTFAATPSTFAAAPSTFVKMHFCPSRKCTFSF